MVEYKSSPFTEASLVSSLSYQQPNQLEFLKSSKSSLEKVVDTDISAAIQVADAEIHLAKLTNAVEGYESAISYLDKAEKMGSGDRSAAINYKKAQALFGLDRIAESEQVLNQAIESDENHPELFLLKGDLHAKTDEVNLSIQSYQKAAEKYNNSSRKWISDYISMIKAITRLLFLQKDSKLDVSIPRPTIGDIYMDAIVEVSHGTENDDKIMLDGSDLTYGSLNALTEQSFKRILTDARLEPDELFGFSQKPSPEFTFHEMFKYNDESYSSDKPISFLENVIKMATQNAQVETNPKLKAKWHIYTANALMLQARLYEVENAKLEEDKRVKTAPIYNTAEANLTYAEESISITKLLPEEYAVLQDRKAKLALLRGRFSEGESLIKLTLQNFQNPRLHYNLAETKLRFGDKETALKHYQDAVAEFVKLPEPTREEYFSVISALSRLKNITDNLQITPENLVQQGVEGGIFTSQAAKSLVDLLNNENEKLFPSES